MASGRLSRSAGGSGQGQRIPASSIPEAPEDTSTSASPQSPRMQRRPSSIRFSEATMSRSPTSERFHRRTSSTEEILPIRQAEGKTHQNYNTTSTATDGNDSAHDHPPGSSSDEHAHGSISSSSQRSEEKTKWYKSLAEKYGSVSLENKGSVARDHLALERTFLAWLRTSLAFASIGIAITQLFRLNTSIASRSQQYFPANLAGIDQQGVPFSPMMGYSIPFEALDALQGQTQQVDTKPSPTAPMSTLLDQLLYRASLPRTDTPSDLYNSSLATSEDAAANLRHVGKPLGATFLGVSIIVLFVGFHRYFEAQHWIIRGKFPASRGSVALVGFIAGTLIVASLVVVLVIAPTSFEKK